MAGFNKIEAVLHMTLESLSNGDKVEFEDAWFDEAAEEFKAALIKQLRPEPREFKLRSSNLGRPLCQLQMEKNGAPKARMPYNHIVRMMIGDATEVMMNLFLKAAKVNVTDSKVVSTIDVNGTTVRGENDIEIDNKVYDIKSSSPYSFTHKWERGWNGVYEGDTFGYAAQLYSYAKGDPARMGGWIVVEKSSGEVKVVPAEPTATQLEELAKLISDNERAITEDRPFERKFEAEAETYYRKETGNIVIPVTCTFCSYITTCWPEARLVSNPSSKAKAPVPKWYLKLADTNADKD